MYVRLFMCIYVRLMFQHRGQRGRRLVPCSITACLSSRGMFSLAKAHISSKLAVLQDPKPCLSPFSIRVKGMHLRLFIVAGDLNPGPHACWQAFNLQKLVSNSMCSTI